MGRGSRWRSAPAVVGVAAVALLWSAIGCKGRSEAGGSGGTIETPPSPGRRAAPESPREEKVFRHSEVQPIPRSEIARRIQQFAATPVDFDEGLLTPVEKKVVRKLVEAAQYMDRVFLLQVDPQNPATRASIAVDSSAGDVLTYFDIMYGPWDRLDHNRPFWGDRPKPPGAGFYPPDLTREKWESFLEAHPDKKDAFTSYFTVITRDASGGLVAVPYSRHYRELLEPTAALLREAAALTPDTRLKRYLETRAAALLTDDYLESDMAWMDLGDGKIEVVIGPYEVYEDELFGYKAAFEAFVCIRDPKDSAQLQELARHLPELESALPIPDEHKNRERGTESPISVVLEILSAGDTRAGVQTTAFNLPNDERVRKAKGSKKVLLKNVAQAKFDQSLVPIARTVLDPAILPQVAFEPYFLDVLMHEMAHGLGPGFITLPDGSRADVNRALRDLYPAIEEAKADIVGLYSARWLAEAGHLDRALVASMYPTYLAGIFRAVRFGATEAHGKAVLLIFNYLMDRGGFTYEAGTGRFSVDRSRIEAAVRDLAHDLLMVQARGSYEEARAFLDRHGTMRPEMKAAILRLGHVPVDIKPEYTVLRKMQNW